MVKKAILLGLLLMTGGCVSDTPVFPPNPLKTMWKDLTLVTDQPYQVTNKVILLPPPGKKIDFVYPKGLIRTNYNWTLLASPTGQYWFVWNMKTNDFDSEGYLPIKAEYSALFFKLQGTPK